MYYDNGRTISKKITLGTWQQLKKMVLEHIIYCHVVLWDSFFNKEKIMVDWSKLIFHVLFCCGRSLFYWSNLQGSKVHLVHTPLSYVFLMLYIWKNYPWTIIEKLVYCNIYRLSSIWNNMLLVSKMYWWYWKLNMIIV